MPKIPLIIAPESDELMISYLWRLAQHNGLGHVSDLLQGYIWPNNELRQYQRQRIRVDANNIFPAFYQAIDIPLDQVKFYLDHTIYKGLVPLTNSGWHMQMIAHAFHSRTNIADIIGVPDNMLDELRICPCCQKEDMETKGFWYYHTFHHMPGVTVCAKHHVPLQTLQPYSVKALGSVRPFDTANKFQNKIESSLEWAVQYASFAASLLDEQIDTEIRISHQAILNTLKKQGMYDDIDKLVRHAHGLGCNTLTDKQLIRSIKTTMHGGDIGIARAQSLSFMVLCFPTIREYKEAIKDVPQDHIDLNTFLSLINDRYDVSGDFYKPLLEMIKKDTGEHFFTTLKGFNYGWRENSADAQVSSVEKFEELFQNATDDSYQLISKFKSMTQPITVLHKTCGSKYQVLVRDFLIYGRRCNCERSYTPKEAKQIVEQHKGFKLISYPIGNYKPCVILHEYCGNTFESTLAAFKNNPKCKRCEMAKDHSEENIGQLVKDLVGDEYTVIDTEGKANGRITIRHNVCGKEHTYLSRMFTEGSRCPYCNNFAKNTNFKQYVSEVSGGKYKIGKQLERDTSRFEVIDTSTGESRIFTRIRIMQELTRPTPSQILPLDKKFSSDALKTHQDIIWEYLIAHYKPDDYICSYEIPEFKEIPKNSMSVEISLLCSRKKKLFRVYTGHHSIYAFKDVHLTPEEIMNILYIKRNGVRYGCVRSKTLAYELGLLPDAPKTIYIMSNIYYGMTPTHLKSNDFDIRLCGQPVLITDNNYRILQFIDLCYIAKYYGWRNVNEKIAEFAKTNGISVEKVEEYLPYYKERMQLFVRRTLEELKL